MVNSQMGPQHLEHHITDAHTRHLKEALGDVQTLPGLAGMGDTPLTSVLRSDGRMIALQIVSSWCFLAH